MVQKSRLHQLRLVVYLIIYKSFEQTSQQMQDLFHQQYRAKK